MENQNNYFDKFVEDLARREEQKRDHAKQLERAKEMWERRQELDRKYREHSLQRIRYSR
jgi:mRNA-degrading endonuclease YafQ of YafQ-DinJ toxin-antitoxin module